MKKISVITLIGLIGLSALAEGPDAGTAQLRPTARVDASQVLGSEDSTSGVMRPRGRPTMTTDAEIVLGTSGSLNSDGNAKFILESGHYMIGNVATEEKHETHSLFVTTSMNNPDKYIGLYIENSTFKNHTGSAQIMEGTPINNGRAIQFAPVKLGKNGNVMNSAVDSSSAKAILISKNLSKDKPRYPFLIKGVNNSTQGVLLGMRGAVSNLSLKATASYSMYRLQNDLQNQIVLDGVLGPDASGEDQSASVSEFLPSKQQQNDFLMTSLNGDYGSFFSLVDATYDPQSTEFGAKDSVVKFAVLISIANSRWNNQPHDCMLILTPSGLSGGSMQTMLYMPQPHLGFFQKLFRDLFGEKTGRETPKLTNGNNPFRSHDDFLMQVN